MSDDIPLIFAQELRAAGRKTPPTAVFLSAASASQMQQYSTAGWHVLTASDFKSAAKIDLTAAGARTVAGQDRAPCVVLSCEATHLPPDTASRIQQWQPDIVKINCAFHGVSDAGTLAPALTAGGYTVLGAKWRDDNSFGLRSLERVVPLEQIQPLDWDRINLIGVRDAEHTRAILTVARLYSGEEQRIAELRVANMIRNDHIARLEDALVAKQPSDVFKLRPS